MGIETILIVIVGIIVIGVIAFALKTKRASKGAAAPAGRSKGDRSTQTDEYGRP